MIRFLGTRMALGVMDRIAMTSTSVRDDDGDEDHHDNDDDIDSDDDHKNMMKLLKNFKEILTSF